MKTLVIGEGMSVIPAVNLLLAKGETCDVFVRDYDIDPADVLASINSAEEAGVYVGSLPENVLESCNDVVLTDDVLYDPALAVEVRSLGHRVIGEMELSFSYDRGRMVAVAGTKGKTSCTALLGKIIKDRTRNAFIIQDPEGYADAVYSTTRDSTSIVKTSIRQLEVTESFHPVVSVIVNIKPGGDNDMPRDEYISVIERVMSNQDVKDRVILNYEDDLTRAIGMRLDKAAEGPRPFFFSIRRELKRGLFMTGGRIILRDGWGERELMRASDLKIIGSHNLENAFAAIAAAYKYGIPTDHIIKSCKEFEPVAHRVEYVATKNGVRFYNNSKGTDVGSAINGIEAMDCPTYLIGGGYDDGSDYGALIDSFGGKVRKFVLIGQTRERMASTAQDHGFYDYIYADNLEEAVSICTCHANPGEAVLLSPACEGKGMYRDYEERGNAFRTIVERL